MPSNVSLQGIEFSIKGSADEASKSVKQLTQELNELKDALKKSEGIGGLATSLKKFENINTTMLSVAVTILKEISQLDFTNIREAAQGIKDIADAARQVANMGSQDAPLEQVIGEPDKLRTALSYVQQFGHALGSTVKVGLKGIGMAAKGIGNLIANPFKQGFAKVKGYAESIKGVASSFKRILGYRIIRAVIKEITQAFQEGIKNLYGWSKAFGGAMINGKNFSQTMDGIATSLGYFKNSIGAAVAPLISALAPALDFIIDKVVSLINVINQLLAKLSGATSWNMAIKKAQEYDDAVSGAGGAAKKAMEYLAPFDELNVLPDPKSGGGGGGGTDYSGMFEESTEFMEGIADFAESIRTKVANGDWQGLGELLGSKVNELVDKIDFAGIGSKIGGYINAWFTTRYWTLDTINFTNIGGKIAEFFNNAIGQIDFEIIGRTVYQKFTIIADFIIGAIEGIDWGLVTKSVGDFIKGSFHELSDWLQETDFATLASSIYQGLKDAIANIDLAGIAQSIWTFIGSALGAATSFIAQLGKDMLTDLGKAIENAAIAWDTNGDGNLTGEEIIKGIWEGIKNAVKNVGQFIRENVFMPFIEGFKEAFKIHSPSEAMMPYGELITEGILAGIKNAWKNIKSWLLTNLYNPMAEAWNSLVGEDSRFALPIYGEVQEVGMGSTVHVSSSGHLHGGSNGTFSLDMDGNVTNLNDALSVSKKIVNGITAGLTTAKDNIPASQKSISTVAKFTSKTDDLTDSATRFGRQISATARFTSKVDNLTDSATQYGRQVRATARFTSKVDNLTDSTTQYGRQISAIANFTSKKDNLNDRNINTNAYIKDYYVDSNLKYGSYMKVNANIYIKDQANTPTVTVSAKYNSMTPTIKATGGAFYGGSWHDIPQYASGGKPHGSLFLAGEAGAELVGHVGGRTEVLNQSQLAATMYSAVKSAMASTGFRISASPNPVYNTADGGGNEDALYRAFRRALDETDFGGDVELDGQTLYRAMVNRNRQNTRLTGVNAMA